MQNAWLKLTRGFRVREAIQSMASESECVSILLVRFTTLQRMILYDRKQEHVWLLQFSGILASPECTFCPIDFWCGS